MLGIEHNSKLFRALRVLTRHDCPRMWPVRNTTRMQGNGRRLNSATRPKISPNIKQHLVCFDIVMNPRNLHRLRVIIEHTGGEGADDISPDLKGLVNRRRLMNSSSNGFEILSVERVGIKVT